MAVIAATRANVAPTNEQFYTFRTYRVAEDMLAGMVAIFDASGYIIQTDTAPIAGVPIAGLALRRASISEALTLFQEGFISGFDVSGMAYGALIYAGANGELDTAGAVVIGAVLPFTYTGEKMAYIDVRPSWLL